MSISVIGAGFGRTGTHSLKTALEILGFGPCHHMFEVHENPDQLRFWRAVANGHPVDWDEVFTGYRSQVDWPGAAYWRQLHEYYPKAKVILTVRDCDAWYDSLFATIIKSVLVAREHSKIPESRASAEMIYQTVFHGVFGGRIEDRLHAIQVYNEHTIAVKETVPSHQLFIHSMGDGWSRLCAFLEVEEPDIPYPVSNSREQFLASKVHLNFA